MSRAARIATLAVVLIVAGCGQSTTSTTTATTTAMAPSTTAMASTTSAPSRPTTSATAVPIPSTTTRRPPPDDGRVHAVDTRNPQPADAARFARSDELLESAVDLPDGRLLLAVRRRDEPSVLCSAVLYAVDRATGARTTVARGREPQVSPDGRTIVFAAVGEATTNEGTGCRAIEVRWGPVGGPFRALPDPGSGPGTIALRFTWSPDGARILYAVGWFESELAGYLVLDVRSGTTSETTITPAFVAQLEARVSGPCGRWVLWPMRWLTDGSLVGVVLCAELGAVDTSAIPWWWHVPSDGVLSSFDHVVTDEVLLQELPPRGG